MEKGEDGVQLNFHGLFESTFRHHLGHSHELKLDLSVDLGEVLDGLGIFGRVPYGGTYLVPISKKLIIYVGSQEAIWSCHQHSATNNLLAFHFRTLTMYRR